MIRFNCIQIVNKSATDILIPNLPKPPAVSPPGTRGSQKFRTFTNTFVAGKMKVCHIYLIYLENTAHKFGRGAEKEQPSKDAHRLNPRIVETWLNDTLKDTEDETEVP